MSPLARRTIGIDKETFALTTVDGYEFAENADVAFEYRHTNLSFSLVNQGAGAIEYSFNGVTLHGDLTVGTPTEAIFFDNRNIAGIWFRARDGESVNSVVRVEGWAL